MKKILQLNDTFIHHIPADIFLFSFLQEDSEEFIDMIMNNYIEFYSLYLEEEIGNHLTFRFSDTHMWNKYRGLDFIFISKDNLNIVTIESIKEYLQGGHRLLCCIDTFYIKGYSSYKKGHVSHEIMICGFNESDSTFICRDYFEANGYSESEVSAFELQQAIEGYPLTGYKGIDTGLVAVRKGKDIKAHFRKNELRYRLKNLLEREEDITFKNYGINVFTAVIKYLNENTGLFDLESIRIFCNFLYEYMMLMKKRIQYLYSSDMLSLDQKEELDQECNILANKFAGQRNVLIKSEMHNMLGIKKKIDHDKLVNEISEWKDYYEKFIKNIIHQL